MKTVREDLNFVFFVLFGEKFPWTAKSTRENIKKIARERTQSTRENVQKIARERTLLTGNFHQGVPVNPKKYPWTSSQKSGSLHGHFWCSRKKNTEPSYCDV